MFLSKSALFLSVILLTACASQGKSKKAMEATPAQASSVYGNVIAGPGQSEVVIENTLPVPIQVFLNGQIAGTVKARSAERLVVPDGNHYIRVRSADRNAASSRDVQFYTQSRRFFFKATGPNATSVSLHRENAFEINTAQTAAPTSVTPQGQAVGAPPQEETEVQLSETALGKDKAAMFDRLDARTSAPAPAPAAPASTQAAPSTQSAPAGTQAARPGVAVGVKHQIAVYVTGDKSEGERKALGTKMLVALVNSGRYIAIERTDEFLLKIDEEHMKQRGGSVDDNQISNLGKQFGVRYVCVATITHAFGAYQVSARIIDVETAVVIAIGEDNSQLRNMDDLDSVSFRVVRAMLR